MDIDVATVTGVVVTCLLPALGWLTALVISHGRHIARLDASLAAWRETVGGRLDLLPTAADVADLRVSMERLHGDCRVLTEQVAAQRRLVDRHERCLAAHQEGDGE